MHACMHVYPSVGLSFRSSVVCLLLFKFEFAIAYIHRWSRLAMRFLVDQVWALLVELCKCYTSYTYIYVYIYIHVHIYIYICLFISTHMSLTHIHGAYIT